MASTIAKHIHKALSDWIANSNDHRDDLDVIDMAIQGKTISVKEVARLQATEQILAHDLIRTRAEIVDLTLRNEQLQRHISFWLTFVGEATKCALARIEEFKSKLWDAEQEIHDLKYALEKESEKLQKEQEQNRALTRENLELFVENRLVWQTPDDIWFWEWDRSATEYASEQITPPPCLKPNDAVTWSNKRVEDAWRDANGTF